jgi:aryl-phospho-beta-D-glucosidase BglC (GH1 family)
VNFLTVDLLLNVDKRLSLVEHVVRGTFQMSCRFIFAILLACFTASTGAQAQFAHTQGKEIVDGNGKPLLLRGIGLGNWFVPEGYMWHLNDGGPESPREIEALVTELIGPERAHEFWHTYRENYITQPDIHFIKQCGFNSIRVPLHYKFFETDDGEGFILLDRVIQWARQENLYIILDMHAAPGGQTGKNIDDSDGYPWLFSDAGAQQHTISVWQRLARHYRNNPTVLGYDLLNEPVPNYPKLEPLNSAVEPLYKRLATAIREVDTHHILILGGSEWDTNFSIFGPPFDKNVVYTFHRYHAPAEQVTVQKYVDFRDKNNVPIWLGESGENADDWIATFVSVLKNNDIGWAFWPYKKMQATTSVVSFAAPEGWDSIVQFAKLTRATSEEAPRLKVRPEQPVIDRALAGILKNIPFRECTENKGYIHALLSLSSSRAD